MDCVHHQLVDDRVRTLEAGAAGLEVPAEASRDEDVSDDGEAVREAGENTDVEPAEGVDVRLGEQVNSDGCGGEKDMLCRGRAERWLFQRTHPGSWGDRLDLSRHRWKRKHTKSNDGGEELFKQVRRDSNVCSGDSLTILPASQMFLLTT